ncbi:hypothetical protein [Sinorhizobium medicae]|uniref:hypothetical protein n=1 Tax=Sinorhizobium medicae TaxID=110321 RepID=UPI000FD84E69|nr:hypothetical protein [Sinorhizobium medicae]MQX49645.1 hypothetical protein [Sinorhizobium medicae]RVJ40513.1 hypothetical protein CN180_17985 [Sinorhizobium medicae]
MNTEPTLPYEHVHTALCIHEAWLESKDGTPWANYRDNVGAVHARYAVIHMAPQVEAVWEALDADTRDTVCFDWEFVPDMLHRFFYGTGSEYPTLQGTVEANAAEIDAFYAKQRNAA